MLSLVRHGINGGMGKRSDNCSGTPLYARFYLPCPPSFFHAPLDPMSHSSKRGTSYATRIPVDVKYCSEIELAIPFFYAPLPLYMTCHLTLIQIKVPGNPTNPTDPTPSTDRDLMRQLTDRPTDQASVPTELLHQPTDRPTDRPTDPPTDRQTHRPTDRQTDRPTDRQTDGAPVPTELLHRQTNRPTVQRQSCGNNGTASCQYSVHTIHRSVAGITY